MNAPLDAKPDAKPDAAADAQNWARSLPKVLLHEHLDGGLRVSTLRELARARGLALPARDDAGLAAWFDANAHAGSLEKYLEGFALTVAAMASPEAMRRVAQEAADDAADDGVVLAEFRIAPLLFEPFGIGGDDAVEAMLQGLADSRLPLHTHSGLIVCAMRHEDEASTMRAAELALRWMGRGVVGFDLAGAERGHPPSQHARTLAAVREAGLAMTLHAGEADHAERVLEAGRLGARRIGHGVRLVDSLTGAAPAALLDEAHALGLHLEVCPTSNVHTGAADSLASHPILALWRAGVSLGFNTDNRLMSRVSASSEAAGLLRETALTAQDLRQMTRQAAAASFLAEAARQRAIACIDAAA